MLDTRPTSTYVQTYTNFILAFAPPISPSSAITNRMSTTTNHTITTTDASGAPVEAIATTIQPAPGAPDGTSSVSMTSVAEGTD